jgi:hypothetical protein
MQDNRADYAAPGGAAGAGAGTVGAPRRARQVRVLHRSWDVFISLSS